ncbi:MAG TPA: SprT family zinc-dependent metalloprotease [Burkholderiales bacterium]
MFGFLQLDLPFLRSPAGDDPVRGAKSRSPEAAPEEPRRILLGNQLIDYQIRRSAKRRTLGLTIDTRGLRVAAPLRASQAEIDKLIYANTRWVLAKLKEWQRPENLPRVWCLSDPLPLFGLPRPMKIAPGRAGLAKFDDLLILTVPNPQAESAVRAKLRDLLKAQARDWFLTRLAHYCAAFGVAVPDLRISQAATRWGSCARSAEGEYRISLNWRMIHFEPRLIDYVIAHEVAHIKHMHHGPRFWAAVGKLYPDYEAARDEIKRRALELPEI